MIDEILQKLPAIVASGFVLIFVADTIGNFLHFESRVGNAFVTCIIWGILFYILNYLYGTYTEVPLVTDQHLWPITLSGVALAFISDLIGNTFSFRGRFRNSFVTSIIWAVAFTIIALILYLVVFPAIYDIN